MQELLSGIYRFQHRVFTSQRNRFRRLEAGQHPSALFITCSDSRIDPSLLTQTRPGELFIMRNVGNIVPRYRSDGIGEAAAIEYAVSVLKVQDVVVCGHSHCGAMSGLLNPELLAETPAVSGWLAHAKETARIMCEQYPHLTEASARLVAAIEENVLVQLENLRTHPAVAAALSRDTLNLHGWVYQFETGKVFTFETQKHKFVEFDKNGGLEIVNE